MVRLSRRLLVAHLLGLLAGLRLAPVGADRMRAHIVRPGETLPRIAERYGVTWEAIAESNDLVEPDLIRIGQILVFSAPDNPRAGRPHGGKTGPNSILAHSRVVTYYGNPWSAQMGILGELSKEELVARLRELAAEYEQIGGQPVKPAIHMVATVAQDSPGDDGMWRVRMPAELIQEYADLAAANDMLFFVDIQIGHSDWPAEIEAMRPFLSQPHVHLAMDPEFDMDPGQAPGEYIGSTKAADVNHAIRYLAGLSRERNLPPKILILHQFRDFMLPDKEQIQDDPRVDVVIDMDGFGVPQDKLDVYRILVRDQPVEFAGIKLFYRQDPDLLSPQQVIDLNPPPALIIYQ
jgi:LysM repeat protein